ncbi:VanZ family protein [Spongorhabdus nitratireducens]
MSFIKNHYTTLNRIALGLALTGIMAVCLMPASQLPAVNLWDKLEHAAAFFVLAILADAAFPATGFGWLKGSLLACYGALIEILQITLTADRMFELADIVADVSGIGFYLLLIPVIRMIPVLRWRWQAL